MPPRIPANSRDRRLLFRECTAGFAAGTLGTAWILHAFTYPFGHHGVEYHVPIAIVVAAAAEGVRGRWSIQTRPGLIAATLVAAVLVAGRVALDWPASGHGLLGALIATTRHRTIWRALGAAICVQAWLTKMALSEPSADALIGAAIGVVLGVGASCFDDVRSHSTGGAAPGPRAAPA